MTKAGGAKLRENMIARYMAENPTLSRDEAYELWKQLLRSNASKGGKLGKDGGFASNIVGKDGLTGRERSIVAGRKGGRISRRTYTTHTHKI